MGIIDKITEGVSDVASKMAHAVGDVVEAVTSGTGETDGQTDRQADKQTSTNGMIRVQYYRSVISTPKTHKQIVRSIGLTKLNQIVERPDTDSIRGIVRKVPHLLRIVE